MELGGKILGAVLKAVDRSSSFVDSQRVAAAVVAFLSGSRRISGVVIKDG